MREYNRLKDKLISSREYNASRENYSPRGMIDGQRNSAAEHTRTLSHQQPSESNAIRGSQLPTVQSNNAIKSMKTYDFITGHKRIYNVAVPQ